MVLHSACMLNMDLVTRSVLPIPPSTVPHRSSLAELPTYDEAITSDQGITAQARIAPGTQSVLHHIDYSSDPEEARIHFELMSPTRRVRSRERYERSLRRSRRRDFPDNSGISHYHYYQGDINIEQPPWMAGTTRIPEALHELDKLLEEMMEVPLEMKVIQCLKEEILVEVNHLTVEDLKLPEEGGLEDHLMEIPEVMDPQAMEDIPQEEVHQEEEDLQDHQEEDHLVHLETLNPQEIKDPQVPWTSRTEDPQAHKDL